MNLNFLKYLISFLILAGCETHETQTKEYGFAKKENSDLVVSLKLSEFKNYGKLIDRIREVTCKDSIPKIVIEKTNVKRHIYPIEDCNPGPFDPSEKHYVSIRNGKPFKYNSAKMITSDNLNSILIEDFVYQDNKSDRAEFYLVIIMASQNEKAKHIEKFIHSLTKDFDKINSDLELNILFWENISYVAPPMSIK